MANWYEHEDRKRRKTRTVRIGKVYTFVALLPSGDVSLPPARGTDISSITRLGTGAGISDIGIRVRNHWWGKNVDGRKELFVEAIEPLTY